MATAGEIQTRLDELRALRARGVAQTTQFGIGSVVYRSDAEIAAAIADLERQLAVATETTATAGTPIAFGYGKGVV